MIVEHGGNAAALAEAFGYSLDDCLDFSANINPLGLSPRLRDCLLDALDDALVHYPDSVYRHSREALGDHHGLDSSQVLLGNGAVELFYDLARFFHPQTLLTLSPTFMEYEKAFAQVQTETKRVVLEAPDYSWSFEQLLPALETLAAGDAVLICNPNNPTGSLSRRSELEKLASFLQEREMVLIVDEAFMDFLEDERDFSFTYSLKDFPNAVVVRSLTKFYAIPGLRLGYALSCHPACFEAVEGSRAPWSVNALADKAVPALLGDRDYQEATRQWLRAEQAFLYQGLSAVAQLRPVRPSVNYIFFEYLGPLDLRQELRKRKIFIRSCQNYPNLTDRHYRVAIRSRQENEQLLAALTAVLMKEADDARD
ncbi:L-threonine 3-O-phosphate decarboxylase [Streptococcus sp. DD11]|uniref:threonine-phosphate decarboxylase CobD n=1 Tax=Streptococcus sp. DD11 TaxID=1777879 RepID=UPI000795FD0D|nr:threonine-phosphate decarboxylase CobD [Streptococcus sp. DD11]KXT83799.1 L-threonine 3-O-phosphate decarboxylase [Streptococcus sp. DD11]